MKKRRIIAAFMSAMCLTGALSIPTSVCSAEAENRNKVYEPSLIIPKEIAYICDTLDTILWDKETHTRKMDAFTELDKDRNIIVVADNEDVLAVVKAFVKEKELDESLIGYRIESFADMVPTGYTVETPVTNDELEALIAAMKQLNTFLLEKGYLDNSACTSLYWGRHSIECSAKSYAVEYDIRQFIKESGIAEDLVTVIVAPEADYSMVYGGQRSYDEVNTIVADEYISLKNYLNDSGMLSNVYLTTKTSKELPDVPYSCVEVYVKTKADADTLKAYMDENYYWQDVVEVTVQPDLSADTDSTIHNKDYICLEGDSNDDGEFGVADVIKLQKYILTDDTMYEREAVASDLIDDGEIDVFDLVMAKRKLISG